MNRFTVWGILGLAVMLVALSAFAAEEMENGAATLVKQAHGKWKSGDLDGALTDLSKAIELAPESADAHYARGKVKFDKGDLEGARLDREKALALNPEKEYAPYAKKQPIWIVLVFIGLIFATVSVLVVEIGIANFSWSLSEGQVGNEAWGIEPDDLRTLPLACVHAGDLREAERLRRFALRYGVAATAVAVAQYLFILQSSQIRGSLLTLLLCTSVPVGLIFATVGCYRRGGALRQSARRLTITSRKVTLTEPTPLGEEEWSEPLDAYKGVEGRIETRGSGDDTYSVFVVDLAHPVEEKTLCLNEKRGSFEGSAEEDPSTRKACAEYARHLDVPALLEGEEETVARAPEDVLKSAGARIREGGQEVIFDPHRAIPDGLDVEAEGEVTVVTVRSATNPRLFMCVTGAAALWIGVLYWRDAFVSAPLAVALLGLALYWKPRDARVRISKQTVGLGTVSTQGERLLQSVETSRIIDVKVSAKYESGAAVWRSSHSLRRSLDEFATFTADSLEAVGGFLRKVRTRITAPADAEEPAAAGRGNAGPVPETYTRTVHFLTEDGTLAVPTRMSPEAAEWLCNLILSLLAAGAEASPGTHEERRAVAEEAE